MGNSHANGYDFAKADARKPIQTGNVPSNPVPVKGKAMPSKASQATGDSLSGLDNAMRAHADKVHPVKKG